MSFLKESQIMLPKRKERQEEERKQNEGKQLVTDFFSKKGEHKLENKILQIHVYRGPIIIYFLVFGREGG